MSYDFGKRGERPPIWNPDPRPVEEKLEEKRHADIDHYERWRAEFDKQHQEFHATFNGVVRTEKEHPKQPGSDHVDNGWFKSPESKKHRGASDFWCGVVMGAATAWVIGLFFLIRWALGWS